MHSAEYFVPSDPGRLLLTHPSSPTWSLCLFLRRPELPLPSSSGLLHGAPEGLKGHSCAISTFGVKVCTQLVVSNDLHE